MAVGNPYNTFDPDPARLNYQLQQIMKGDPIDAAVIYSQDGTCNDIVPLDGRHRMLALLNAQANFVPVMVPQSQHTLFGQCLV